MRLRRRGVLPVVAARPLMYHAGMYACRFCGAEVKDPRGVHRSTTCDSCHRDLKICLNCKFYSPGAHWDCSESIDEPVHDKERSNFCTFFVFRDTTTRPAPGKTPTQAAEQKARSALDKLFGDGK